VEGKVNRIDRFDSVCLASFARKGQLPHFHAQVESSATVLVPPKKLAFVWKATIARAGPL
jgi:hypothetical protein